MRPVLAGPVVLGLWGLLSALSGRMERSYFRGVLFLVEWGGERRGRVVDFSEGFGKRVLAREFWREILRRRCMAQARRDGPYIWVTWLTKLLVGEHSCEWASWFRAQHEGWSWTKAKMGGDGFDPVGWQMAHTAGINDARPEWEELGYSVFTENQNSFALRGKRATLGGKPDLIALRGESGTIIDVKTGKPSPSHGVQVMLYMYAVPRALGQYQGISFDGRISYPDHEVEIPAVMVDEAFIGKVSALVLRLGGAEPARRVPSPRECGFCDISLLDCGDRLDGVLMEEGLTDDF